MAQHDYSIANQAGLAFRADLNAALAAIASTNSGSTAPSATYAGMLWLDTSAAPPVLRRRNAANNGWEQPIALADVEGSASGITLRNKLLNANFAINQRGYVSGAATTGANQYTLDRWRVVTSGQSVTFSASGNGNQVTAPVGGIEQVIEGANIEGGVFTLSWTGTASATVNGVAITNGGQTASLSAGANVTVQFKSGTVKEVMFERAIVKSPFEQLPVGLELALCKRYYEISYAAARLASAVMTGTTTIGTPVQFTEEKRATPSITFSALSSFGVTSGPDVDAVSTRGATLRVVGSANTDLGWFGFVISDAEL